MDDLMSSSPKNYHLSPRDRQFLDLSFEFAEKAFGLQEVPVGCVFVYNKNDASNSESKEDSGEDNGIIVGRGCNETNLARNPTRHAEFVAIEEAERWCEENGADFAEVMRQTTVYVTLEPCIMCASALYQLKIKRIIFGACNPRFGGVASVASNKVYGHAHEVELIAEIDADRSIALLKRFYDRENPFAPEDKRKAKKKFSSDSPQSDNVTTSECSVSSAPQSYSS
ncbi:cytidine and deoxycytidylate deaminase zinc-binding region domain-containing protein [Ditylenchus destructor]|nr:cytidine and deoxycytidylate deaminase zinc-binding region domain-containing protein [Ditylenchus destructor]